MVEINMLQNNNNFRSRLSFVAGALCVVILSGCQSTPRMLEDKAFWEAKVEQRARDRWQALIDRRYSDAYKYFSEPSRQGLSLEQFERQMKTIEPKAVSVRTVKCAAEQCAATLDVTMEYSVPRIGKRQMPLPVDEVWVASNNEAFLVRR